MKQIDKDIYNKRYVERYQKFGYSPLSLGWGKNGKQKVRFQILTEIGIKKTSSILDIGCGFGDLFKYLKDVGWSGNYVGLDINDILLKEAIKQYPEINVKNIDILTDELSDNFDFVLSSGVFNAKLKCEDNYNYICYMLQKMFSLCNEGVAVDFLSSYVDFKNEIAFHAEPETIFKIAKSISKRILIRHDYMPYEFTLYIYKDDDIIKPQQIFKYFIEK